MKTNSYMIILWSVLFLACGKNEVEKEAQVESNNFTLSFRLNHNQELVLVEDTFITNQNYPVTLLDFKFYLSNLQLVGDSDTALVADVLLVDLKDNCSVNSNIKAGNYHKIIADFGIPDTLNTADPTLQPNESPLGIYGSKGMHWSGQVGYKFLAIDGYAADSVDKDMDIGVSLHTGTHHLFQKVEMDIEPIQISNKQTSEINIRINLDDIFGYTNGDTLDMRLNEHNQSHTFGETATKVTTKFVSSWAE